MYNRVLCNEITREVEFSEKTINEIRTGLTGEYEIGYWNGRRDGLLWLLLFLEIKDGSENEQCYSVGDFLGCCKEV